MAPLIVDIAAFAASEAIEAISEIGPVTDGVCLSLMVPSLSAATSVLHSFRSLGHDWLRRVTDQASSDIAGKRATRFPGAAQLAGLDSDKLVLFLQDIARCAAADCALHTNAK